MATLKSLASEYAEYIRNNCRQPYVISEVLRRINQLSYTNTGQSLTVADKLHILQHVEHILLPSQKRGEDSSIFLEILNQLKQGIRK